MKNSHLTMDRTSLMRWRVITSCIVSSKISASSSLVPLSFSEPLLLLVVGWRLAGAVEVCSQTLFSEPLSLALFSFLEDALTSPLSLLARGSGRELMTQLDLLVSGPPAGNRKIVSVLRERKGVLREKEPQLTRTGVVGCYFNAHQHWCWQRPPPSTKVRSGWRCACSGCAHGASVGWRCYQGMRARIW